MTRMRGASRSDIVVFSRVRRPDPCRRYPRPHRPQRPSHRAQPATACASRTGQKPPTLDPVQPPMERSHPSSGRSATPADINRNGRPTSIGTGGRHQSECPADISGIRKHFCRFLCRYRVATRCDIADSADPILADVAACRRRVATRKPAGCCRSRALVADVAIVARRGAHLTGRCPARTCRDCRVRRLSHANGRRVAPSLILTEPTHKTPWRPKPVMPQRVRLDLTAAISAPYDQRHAGRSGVAERHRWATIVVHNRRLSAPNRSSTCRRSSQKRRELRLWWFRRTPEVF